VSTLHTQRQNVNFLTRHIAQSVFIAKPSISFIVFFRQRSTKVYHLCDLSRPTTTPVRCLMWNWL